MKSEYLIQGNEITYISFCSVIQSLVIYMWSLNAALSFCGCSCRLEDTDFSVNFDWTFGYAGNIGLNHTYW